MATAAGAAELRWVEATVQVGERALLQEVSVQIRPGEHVAVVGASGAGKSTLLATLRGHAALSSGVLHIDGIPAGEAEIHALNARTVWVDPAVRLWNRSVYANLCYGAEDQDPTTILEAAELDGLLARSDRSLASPVGEGGGGFSGGEGQRLRLGRGMLRPAPRLVLLDEAFRGLERDRRTRLLAGARSRWAQATLLCVTHDLEQARTFPRVLVVDQGRVVEDGHPEELLTRQGRFAELLSASSALDQALWEAPDWQRLRLGATP
ncbi:MAG TPA: ATP-binding cassette domain-containing protein [Myxococcota bacterium]|nr:ATP-binding cassette domain-containing protein [Myxococcota bacterium]